MEIKDKAATQTMLFIMIQFIDILDTGQYYKR